MGPRGFSEKRQEDYVSDDALPSVAYANIKIDSAGRVVIPAEMRTAMLTKPGDTLTARVVDGELRVVSRAWVMRRIDEEAARFKIANPGASVADEVAEERREEARLEEERWARLEREAAELRDVPEPG